MTNHWHEQIQRYIHGGSSAQEAAQLHQGLSLDVELRELYLDYVNLEVALADAAEQSLLCGTEFDRTASFPISSDGRSSRFWRWIAAAAACVALVIFVALSARRRHPEPARPDLTETFALTQRAIAQLSFAPATPLAWANSPTESLLQSLPAPQRLQLNPFLKSQTPTPSSI